jgi:hypothetical protein
MNQRCIRLGHAVCEEELRGEHAGPTALRSNCYAPALQFGELLESELRACEHPQRFEEEAAKRAQLLAVGGSRRTALHQGQRDVAASQPLEILHGPGGGHDVQRKTIVGKQPPISLRERVVRAVTRSRGDAKRLRRRRTDELIGDDETRNDQGGDHRPDFHELDERSPSILSRHRHMPTQAMCPTSLRRSAADVDAAS